MANPTVPKQIQSAGQSSNPIPNRTGSKPPEVRMTIGQICSKYECINIKSDDTFLKSQLFNFVWLTKVHIEHCYVIKPGRPLGGRAQPGLFTN